MTKLKKKFEVYYSIEWAHGIEITKLRDDLDALEKLGATHIEMDSYESEDYCHIEIRATCERFETDQEFDTRTKIKNLEQLTIDREMVVLERLKLKYEK